MDPTDPTLPPCDLLSLVVWAAAGSPAIFLQPDTVAVAEFDFWVEKPGSGWYEMVGYGDGVNPIWAIELDRIG